jgi:murein DD-endopeptidase MepM/ murein hydrolase activator NlpD
VGVSARGWLGILLIFAAMALGGLAFFRAEGTPPVLIAPPSLVVSAAGRDVEIAASDADSGVRELSAVFSDAGGDHEVALELFPGSLLRGGDAGADRTLTLRIDPKALGSAEGNGFLRISARDWSWRGGFGGNQTRLEVPVTIDLTAPRVSVASGLTYVERGGSGAVAYSVSEPTARDGVQVGERFYRGVPRPGSNDPNARFAIFAVATDAPPAPPIRVVAEDAAGNTASASWSVVLKERQFQRANITLPQSFLDNKVPELAQQERLPAAAAIETFQTINSKLRAENEARIRELVAADDSEKHWKGAFKQLYNSKVTSVFAERRSYFVDGTQVSEATHYGYDLAATANTPITASNAGRVLFAGLLGIYGECVLVDHGMGITSLYAHLSRIDVKQGETVSQGQTLGLSGQTGLAGGDHLHFAILVGDTYVDPVEWWDARWVESHVENQLGPPPAAPDPGM